MNKDPVVISYFTTGTLYEKEVEALRISCEALGLEYRIEGIAPFGKWHEHTCYKPIYILQKMEELKRPLLWIDADAQIVQKPLFAWDCDLALRLYEEYPPDHPSYPVTGTLYFGDTPEALSFVQSWAQAAQKALREKEFTVDQQLFGRILLKSQAKVQVLPAGYAAIFDENLSEKETFIIHYQASRLYKKMIDEEVFFGVLEHLSVEELRALRPRVNRDI